MEIATTDASLDLLDLPALADTVFLCEEDDDSLNLWWEATVDDIQVLEEIVNILASVGLMFAVSHG